MYIFFWMICDIAISFEFVYQLPTQPPEVWDGGVGFVSKEMIQAHCPVPASDIQVSDYTNSYANNFEETKLLFQS